MLRNGFSLKQLFMATGNLLWPEPCRVMFVYESKIQDIKKKCSGNFIEYFSHSKNGITKCVGTKKLFQRF